MDHVQRANMSKPVTSLRVSDRTVLPTLPDGVVNRPRLFTILESALSCPVVTVTSPAGWGKTQLLSSWLGSPDRQGRVAWLSIDRADTDPQVFWPAVMAALSDVWQETDSVDGQAVSDASVIGALERVNEPLVFVLDDVHLLHNSAVVPGLARLLRVLPPLVRIVLSGQFLPELSLAKLRLEQRVISITSRELAFNASETAEMLATSLIDLPETSVSALSARTEGWPAGLRLAVLSLQDGLHPSELFDQFGGEHVEVREYLSAEVFSHLSPETEDFLLRTSICERLTGDLANALTGREDGTELLRWLTRHNVFTISDGRQAWFRYHTMFSELLRGRLERLGAETVRELHLTASSWFSAHEMPVEAIDHAALAGDTAGTAVILMESWLSMYLDGKHVSLGEVIDRLPIGVNAWPSVAYVRAAVHLAFGDSAFSGNGRGPFPHTVNDAGIDELRTRLRSLWGEPGDSLVKANGMSVSNPSQFLPSIPVIVVDLMSARLIGNLEGARVAAQQLLDLSESHDLRASPTALDLRALALEQLGMTEYWAGRWADAELHLRDAFIEAKSNGRAYVELGCLAQLVLVLTIQNRLTEALAEAESAIALVRQRNWEVTGPAAELWHALGWVAYLRGDLDLAEKHLEGASLAVRRQDASVGATVLLARGLTANLRGRKEEALALLAESHQAMEKHHGRYVFEDYVIGEEARIKVAIGDVIGARALLAPYPDDPSGPIHLSIARTEILLNENRRDAALTHLEEAARLGQGLTDQRLQALVLLALLQSDAEDRIRSKRTMLEALELAEPEGYIQPFVQFGRAIEPLLRAIAADSKSRHPFINSILDHGRLIWISKKPVRAKPYSGGILQTTEREMEVLRALDSLASLAEISESLFISSNTLKAHLRSLYRKLDVGSRRAAVKKAQTIGLI